MCAQENLFPDTIAKSIHYVHWISSPIKCSSEYYAWLTSDDETVVPRRPQFDPEFESQMHVIISGLKNDMSSIAIEMAKDDLVYYCDDQSPMRVGFAPLGTQLGDKICKLKGTTDAAIIHVDDEKKNQQTCQIVGRAGELWRKTEPFWSLWLFSSVVVEEFWLTFEELQSLAKVFDRGWPTLL